MSYQRGSGFENPLQQVDPSRESNCLPLQQKQSYDECCPPQAEVHVPATPAIQSSDKNLVHIQEPDRVHILDGGSQFITMQQMSNPQSMETGTSNPQPTAIGMRNSQPMKTGTSNPQPMVTRTSNPQPMATGTSTQPMATGSGNSQPMATGSGNSQPMATGSGNSQPMATGRGTSQPMATGTSNQHPMALGTTNQQLVATGTSNPQLMATGTSSPHPIATGMSSTQPMTTGTSNPQPMATGTSNPQPMGPAMTSQQPMAMSNQQPMATAMRNQQPMADMNNQQSGLGVQVFNRGKQVPFALLLPALQGQLDKDRAFQLQTIYQKLRTNDISKDGFIRHMRSIVGDQMLKTAVYKLQGSRNVHAGPQFPSQSQASLQQLQKPSTGSKQFSDSQSPAFQTHASYSTGQLHSSTHPIMDTNAQMSRDAETQPDLRGMPMSQMSTSMSGLNQDWESSTFPLRQLNKQQQQHVHFAQGPFSSHGNTVGNYHQYSSGINASPASLKQQSNDMQTRQVPVHQSMSTSQAGGITQTNSMTGVPKFERPNSLSEPKKILGGSHSHLANNSALQQTSSHWQSSTTKDLKNDVPSPMTFVKQEPVDQANDQQKKSSFYASRGLSSLSSPQVEDGSAYSGSLKDESPDTQSSKMHLLTPTLMPSVSVSSSISNTMESSLVVGSRLPSTSSPMPSVTNIKTPPKKPSVGHKKPLEALGSSPPLPSKKQKVSGAFSDQSIEQLNDVTAVSGVNLREEEEQLLSGPEKDIRVSEASRRVVQEEEERLILKQYALQKKLVEILAKCGMTNMSCDVERCLSLAVEERMRGLISNLIRLSKQRVDIEKPRHKTIITSDVRQQIMMINQKAREKWEKRQTEAEKLQKMNEPEGCSGVDGDKEKDDIRVKSAKTNKDEDDKMRATAANVAARVAVGGDDMLSKWQLMAEQARQKREGGIDVESGSQTGREIGHKPVLNSVQNAMDNQEAEKKSHPSVSTSGATRKFGRVQFGPQNGVARNISVKDLIVCLEREPQMSKSKLVYRLYEKPRLSVVPESS